MRTNQWWVCSCLVALLTGINWCARGETFFERQETKLRAEPVTCQNSFDFVIVGDIQFGETFKYAPELYSMIQDWNALRPPLIFVIGDLILGGAAEGLNKQWDIYEKALAPLSPPFFPLVGGHDISDKASEEIYTKRIGPIMYSLPYGNSLFIALDTEEVGQPPGVLSDEQLQWLKKELASSKAKNIFVMMHQPIYNSKEYGDGWDRVASLFKGYPVRAVFNGHQHYYRDCGVRDGVHYFNSGGGGGDRTGTPEEKGGFAHYLLVQVRGESVNYIVIKPGSLLPSDIVTQLRVSEMEDLTKRIITQKIEVPYGESLNRDISIQVNNPYDWFLNLDLKWKSPSGWHVSPEILHIEAAPKQRVEAKVYIKTDSPEATRFPVPSFETVVSKVKNGGPITVKNNLDFVPLAYAVHAPENMKIDCNLDEWKNAKPIPIIYAYGFDPKDAKDLKSEMRVMWDEKNLYFIFDTVDDDYYQPYSGDIVWAADSVELFIDKWHWGLSLTSKGEEVFLYEAPLGRETEMLNKAVKLTVHRDGTHIIYEAALPASEVAPLLLKPGSSFDLTAIMNDLDHNRKRHWLELTPGWGEFCTGPWVKVILKP